MKLLLITIVFLCHAFQSSAQYKDSLKTFRKLTKSYQKSSDFVFIPSGAYNRILNDSNDPIFHVTGFSTRAHTVSVDSFFMGKFEISNEKYLKFVNDVLRIDPDLGKTYLPDTLVWRTPLGFGEKYVDYYLRHPAYSNYPVVGVSYSQAKAFAEWMTTKYNANEERVFKKVRFRIPTEEEWEYAFNGGKSYSVLPWGSNSTLDEEGNARANFREISQLSIYSDSAQLNYNGQEKKRLVLLSTGLSKSAGNPVAGYLNDSDFTVPVDAFEPNSYGLYQMAGNVEEIVDAYYFRHPQGYEFTYDVLGKDIHPWGVTKGGSWNDTGYYLQFIVRQFYADQDSANGEMGFRLVMEVLDY